MLTVNSKIVDEYQFYYYNIDLHFMASSQNKRCQWINIPLMFHVGMRMSHVGNKTQPPKMPDKRHRNEML